MAVRRAHMVSKGYLQAWANDEKRVSVIDCQNDRGFTTSVDSATVVSYVYDPQVLTVDLEARFAKTEAAGIKALNVLRAQETLTLEMQIAVIEFLDMHLERGRYADQAGRDQRRDLGAGAAEFLRRRREGHAADGADQLRLDR